MTIPVPSQPDAARGDVVVHVFGRTDVGRTREHNEDAFLVVDLSADNASLQAEVRTHVAGPRGTLFMVADGLGGAAAGEIASEMAVTTVHEEMRTRWVHGPRTDAEAFAAAVKASAETANNRIFAYALEHPENRGLGTTATVAGLLGDTLFLAQVGDSRAYLIRDGVARQITKDQSLMQRLIEAGELTPDEAERSERRNIILQALGPEPTVKIDLTYQKLRRGDTLVLCTDGLSGLVKKDEIAEVVVSQPDLVEVCRDLIDRANENGGPDNITVIAARFEGSGLADAEPDDNVGHSVFLLPGQEVTGPTGRPRYEQANPMVTAPTPASNLRVDGTAPAERSASKVWLFTIVALIVLGAVVFAARGLLGKPHGGSGGAAPHDTASGEMKPAP
ncbi:MAG TPA: protein phosphatase 2C domain-containing protein [Gemmatimonadaceae bacterium]|nr:protein phosphatase 2C domain-containing protein [Gemmatimonadaceae bacterium]